MTLVPCDEFDDIEEMPAIVDSWRSMMPATEAAMVSARLLIESSREHGTLEQPEHELLTAMLALQNTTVGQVMMPIARLATVPASASAREVELTSRREGHSRLAVVGPRPDGSTGSAASCTSATPPA